MTRRSLLPLILLLLLLIATCSSFAANHYIRQGAAGAANGTNWTDACTDFTGSCAVASLVRGDTYYVAGGSYAARVWNKAESGSLVITIKKATIADHGIATGWLDSYDTQVTWGFSQDFQSGFWVFDGITYPASAMSAAASVKANYGFTIPHGTCGADGNYPINIGGNSVTVRGLYVTNSCGSSDDHTQYAFDLGQGPAPCNNVTISHDYSEFTSTDVQVQGTTCDNLTIEYLYSKGQWSSPLNHGEVMALGGDNATIRYNYFEQCQGTGCICSGGPALTNFKIYGNVMNNVSNNAPGVTGSGSGGNGAIAGAGANGKISGAQIYNNTIIQPGMAFGWFYTNVGTGGNIVKNNIVWGRCDTNMGGSGNVTDSNTYLSCWQASGTETNKQTGSFDPFVSSNFNAPGIGNYALNSYTAGLCSSTSTLCAGVSLASPFDVDPLGVSRTARWDRGAFALASTPTNTVGISGTTLVTGGVTIK
jgi:hypothetical protein